MCQHGLFFCHLSSRWRGAGAACGKSSNSLTQPDSNAKSLAVRQSFERWKTRPAFKRHPSFLRASLVKIFPTEGKILTIHLRELPYPTATLTHL